MSRTATVLTAGAGAMAMYLLDPDRGRGRRAQAKDRIAARLRHARREGERKRRYAEGVVEGLRHDGPARRPADDQALADRVKSHLGPVLPLDQINLNVVDSVVELRGELGDASRIDEVVGGVRSVAGVEGVTNLMHLPGTPAPTKADARRPTPEP